ncbi:ABC transporter permease [Tepidiforma sp.]|uniref:ABC transporter permease n=1 Tax=Tepidiforma sp. TaxID=2682230 RepID=UPI00262140D1|nr:ABC transporter permease [Tepidiforma sp.]MCX7617883.1 ABC transporter permease [Tepidiforma sp.]
MTALLAAARGAGRFASAYGPSAVLLALLVAGWEAWVRVFDTRPYILPAPSRIWQGFWETKDLLPEHIRTTLAEAVLGLGFGAAAGVTIAVLVAGIPLVRRVLMPLLVVSQTIPMVVLAPLLIVWFGFGMTPKVVVVALWGFFPVAVATADGLMHADREMVGLVRSMGANRLQVLRYIAVPAALPAFFSGLKIAAAYAVGGAVVGEWIGASSGLGLYITRAQTSFRVDRVFVAVVLIALLSMLLFAAVHVLARLATPWMYVRTEEETK